MLRSFLLLQQELALEPRHDSLLGPMAPLLTWNPRWHASEGASGFLIAMMALSFATGKDGSRHNPRVTTPNMSIPPLGLPDLGLNGS